METSKPIWLNEPDHNQTSVRFCCPHCFIWVRNAEFEEHVKLAHPEVASRTANNDAPSAR